MTETCTQRLKARFGQDREFEFLVFSLDEALPFRKRKVERLSAHATRIVFNYRDSRKGRPAWAVRGRLVASVLSAFARVADYRTPEEKSSFEVRQAKEKRERNLRKYGAERGLALLWGRCRAMLRG